MAVNRQRVLGGILTMTTTETLPAPLAASMPAEIPPPSEPIDLDARAEEFRADAIMRTRRLYFEGNCPPDFREFNPDRPEIQANRAQINSVLAWRVNPRGILASGETGRAKTRSMFALCKRLLCEEGKDVAMWHAKDFFAELESNVRYGRDEAGCFVRRLAERSVLFIDDYGQEAVATNKQEWATGWFFRLLDLRIGNRLPLLMTTNMTAKQMAAGARDITGDPLIRRLLELAEPVKFV